MPLRDFFEILDLLKVVAFCCFRVNKYFTFFFLNTYPQKLTLK